MPVPLSPDISTVALTEAALRIAWKTERMALDSPMRPRKGDGGLSEAF